MAELTPGPRQRRFAWTAFVVGALAQLFVPWALLRTGYEIRLVAGAVRLVSDDDFLRLYVDLLLASRFLLVGAAASTAGTALMVWGALRAIVRRT